MSQASHHTVSRRAILAAVPALVAAPAAAMTPAAVVTIAPAVAGLWSRFAATIRAERAAAAILCDEDERHMAGRPQVPDALCVPVDLAKECGALVTHRSALDGGPFRWMTAANAREILSGGTSPRVFLLGDGQPFTIAPPSPELRAFALAHIEEAEAFEAATKAWQEARDTPAAAEASRDQGAAIADREAIEDEVAALAPDLPGAILLQAAVVAFHHDDSPSAARDALAASLFALTGWDVTR